MNRPSIILLIITVFVCNKMYAGSPIVAKPVRTPARASGGDVHPGGQLINHSDWNFVENKGQLNTPEIKYYGHQGGAHLYCKPGMISFVFTKMEKEPDQISEATGSGIVSPSGGGRGRIFSESERGHKTTSSYADLILLNSNPIAKILASDQQEYYENYYTGGSLDSGITNVHSYKTITYKSIYPNIDLVLHARENGMKYEFVVYPGGKVNDIQMKWDGLEGIKKLKDSKIEYSLATGKMTETAPYSFQEIGNNVRAGLAPAPSENILFEKGERKGRPYMDNTSNEIESHFVLKNNIVGFKTRKYDKGKVLVIDPTLIWSTYFGGAYDDQSHGVATDLAGNIFITGHTGSTRNIATMGAYLTYFAGSDNDDDDSLGLEDGDDFGGFLSKFDNSGKLLWSTYYIADCYHVATDNQGSAYITGWAGTEIKTTKGAYESSPSGTFLSKFYSNGQLAWATYYGKEIDSGGSILAYSDAVDDSNNVYMAGTFTTPTHIRTNGHYAGDSEAFLAKFNSSGIFLWSDTIGKSVLYSTAGVATDHYGHVYLTAATADTSGIATSGAYQTAYGGGVNYSGSVSTSATRGSDVFLAQYNGGGQLQWATYFGGPANESSGGIACDRNGSVYISGGTTSYSGISTNGSYQNTSQGSDAFLAKFTPGGGLIWATYFGGDFTTTANGVSTDGSNNVYMAGATACPSGIATSNGYQIHIKGGQDAFVAEFNPLGAIQWATYYGGNGSDGCNDITTDANAKIYITGVTNSGSGLATSDIYQTAYGGGTNDAFLAEFYNRSDINDAGIDSILNPKGSYCTDTLPVMVQLKNYGPNVLDSVKIILSVNGKIDSTFSWTGKLLTDSTVKVNLGNIVFPFGADTLKIWTFDPNGGLDSFPGNDTATTIINSYPLPNASAGPDTLLCYDESYTMQGSGGVSYFWRPATYLSSSIDPNAIAVLPNAERYILLVTNSHGCQDSSQVLLKVRPKLQVKIVSDTQTCYGTSLLLYAKASGGDSLHYHFLWPFDNNHSGDSLTETASTSSWHKVILSDNCSGVPSMDSVYIKVIPPAKAAFTLSPDSPLVREPVTFINQSTNASSFLWEFGNNDTGYVASPIAHYYQTGEYKVELIAYGLDNCQNDTAFGFVNVIDFLVTIYAPNAFTPNGDATNNVFDISGVGIKSYTYDIYNRWGEHIFSSPTGGGQVGAGWDGTFKGHDVPEGVYIYELYVIDIKGKSHFLSGNVTLMR